VRYQTETFHSNAGKPEITESIARIGSTWLSLQANYDLESARLFREGKSLPKAHPAGAA
jgi:hypothetical protein